MIRENVVGDVPQVDSTAYIDPSAVIIGRVVIGAHCYIGANVVIRADRFSIDDGAEITIGDSCSIQDLALLHAHNNTTIAIGDGTIVNHAAVIHAPSTIGVNCILGCKSVVTHGRIGDNVFVRTNAVVEAVTVGSNCFIDVNSVINTQAAAEALRPISAEERAFMQRAFSEIKENPIRHKYSIER